nr:interleukin-1 receptor-associated kinase 4-like isoform X3 [Setaria viridis]
MADIALGSVGKIVQIALKIKEAVETVKQNEKECHDIQRCVARVSALLRKLDEMTETMKDEVMRDALEDLAESLERALELVMECQRKHNFRRFLGAGNMAKELGRVQDDIVRKLQLGNFATSVQTITIMVTNIQSAGGPPPRPPPPRSQGEVIIDGFTKFSLSELKAATENFSDGNKIGSGGTGDVYKGVLQDGQVVAIKKLHPIRGFDHCRPYDEINVFVDLKHKNIIRPLGYCLEVTMVLAIYNGKYVGAQQGEFCFVQEYMENGSMENIMNGSRFIGWSCRFKMIQGIAQGLHYLHEQRVVHMDLKPQNILVDSDMNPRISDFGVAKKLDLGVEKTFDSSIAGTMHYMAPEYMYKGCVSTKCDVYSFGNTLLGTIIGSMIISTPPNISELIQWQVFGDLVLHGLSYHVMQISCWLLVLRGVELIGFRSSG